jgi:hypothetical protein
MRQSYCGLCDDCQLGNAELLQTVTQLKAYINRFRPNVWLHCFPQSEGFSFAEFRKGLDWFLSHTECPGCQGGRGLEDCPVRNCAMARGLDHCYLCPDLKDCDKFDFLLEYFPDVKTNLQRRQLKEKAKRYHQKMEKKV